MVWIDVLQCCVVFDAVSLVKVDCDVLETFVEVKFSDNIERDEKVFENEELKKAMYWQRDYNNT